MKEKKERDKRLVWFDSLRKPHLNLFEARVEELRQAGFKLVEEVVNKYRCREGR